MALWARTYSDSAATWQNGQFGVTSTSSYQVVFTLLSNGPNNGYVALDDITFTVGSCQGNENFTIQSVYILFIIQYKYSYTVRIDKYSSCI